jgi:hypothetical protein
MKVERAGRVTHGGQGRNLYKLQSEQLMVRSGWCEIGIDSKILLKRGLELIGLMVAS